MTNMEFQKGMIQEHLRTNLGVQTSAGMTQPVLDFCRSSCLANPNQCIQNIQLVR
jgi:hypothetical protein